VLGVHASRKASGDDVRTLRRADKERKHISLILIAMRESRVMRADDELLFDLAQRYLLPTRSRFWVFAILAQNTSRRVERSR
jgi:hypothetical protein